MAISLLLLLALLGGGVGVIAMIVFGIAHSRPWIIVSAGGLAFFGVICVVLLVLYFTFAPMPNYAAVKTPFPPPRVAQQMNATEPNGVHWDVNQGVQQFHVYKGGEVAVNSGVKLRGVLMVVVLVGFLIVIVFRRLFFHSAALAHPRVWPFLLPVPIIVIFLWMSLRFESSRTDTGATVAIPEEYRDYRAINDAAQRSAQQTAARQQIMMANQGAHILSQTPEPVAQTGIPVEIDNFDAPRIPLPSQAASPDMPPAAATAAAFAAATTPLAPVPMVAAQAIAAVEPKPVAADDSKSPAKSKKDGAKKQLAGSTQKRKKPAKPVVAEAKLAEEPSDNNDQPSTIGAEEPSDNNDQPSTIGKPPAVLPAWVHEKPKHTGNIRREVIETEEYESPDECIQAGDVYLLLKMFQYVQQVAGRPYPEFTLPSITFRNGMIVADGNVISNGGQNSSWIDGRLRYLNSLGLNIEFARRELVAKDSNGEAREYIDTVDHPSIGPMKKLYLQIEFSPELERAVRQRLDAEERYGRFAMAGIGAGSVLGLLALVFALLKIDTFTKGYYSKRLFIVVPLAILGMFGLYVMLLKMGVDLPH